MTTRSPPGDLPQRRRIAETASRPRFAGIGPQRPSADGVDHRPEVVHRRVELDVVRGSQDEAAVTADRLKPREYFGADVVGRAERQRVLFVDANPRSRALPVGGASARPDPCTRAGPGLRTSRPISMSSGRMARSPVRVVGHLDRRVDRLDPAMSSAIRGLKAPPECAGEMSMPVLHSRRRRRSRSCRRPSGSVVPPQRRW